MGNSSTLDLFLLRELSDQITPEVENLIQSADEDGVIYIGFKSKHYKVTCGLLENQGIVGDYFADIPNDRAGFPLTRLGKEILRELEIKK